MSSFKEDLKIGNKYEKVASYRLTKKYNIKIVEYNNDYRYDFIDYNGVKYEVKYDRKSEKTGNIFLEYSNRNNDSGINKTESDKYIFMFNLYDGCMIDTDMLKNMITNKQYKKNIKCLIDGRVIGGYIFCKKFIIENSIKI